MRSALRVYFPAALEAYADLTLAGPDALELLRKAPPGISRKADRRAGHGRAQAGRAAR